VVVQRRAVENDDLQCAFWLLMTVRVALAG
jgi:hypothetical protein